jgi:hypothetical protein
MTEKIKIYKAGIFFSILALSFSSEKCKHKIRQTDTDMSAYSVNINWDIIMIEDGSYFNLKDTFTIVKKNDTYMYIISIPYEDSYITYNKADSIVDEKVKRGVHYNYYIFNRSGESGIKYDSLNAKTGVKFSTDSFINSKNFFKSGISLDSNYRLIGKVQATKFDEIEIYHAKNRLDENEPDSVYLSFSTRLKAPYSFSNKLDSTRQKKLFKIQIIYNPSKTEKYSFPIARRELLFEIQEISIPDGKYINDLFKRFKDLNPTQK